MQYDNAELFFLQNEEGDQQEEEAQEEEGLHCTVKKLSLSGEEDAVIYKLRGGQEQVKVRELRAKGLSFQIWPAAHALCWYLEDIFGQTGMLRTHHPSHMPTSGKWASEQNMRILELGAGTGMVGILCAVLGGHCTITDMPHVTPNLEHNATLNQEIIQSSGLGGSVVVKTLRWGEQADMEAIGRSFDLIVASDVVYYDHLFEPLLCTLKWLLYPPSCHNTSKVACMEDDVAPLTTTRTTTATTMAAITTNRVSISSYAMPEEGAPFVIPTAVGMPTSIDKRTLIPPSTGENATISEEASLATEGTFLSVPTSGISVTTISETYLALETSAKMPCTTCTIAAPAPASSVPNTTTSIAASAISPTREEASPMVLLAHLRRWKKDSHFFRKASKLFQVTVVHKHAHDANSRTGVTVYAFSRKKN